MVGDRCDITTFFGWFRQVARWLARFWFQLSGKNDFPVRPLEKLFDNIHGLTVFVEYANYLIVVKQFLALNTKLPHFFCHAN